MSSFKGAQTIKRLWKEGWVNIPEVMASQILSAIGVLGVCGIAIYYHNRPLIGRTFEKPLFFRPDDPRAKKTITYYEQGWDKK